MNLWMSGEIMADVGNSYRIDGISVFPFWPAKEYAVLCIHDEWDQYEPESIPINEFIQELLPNLKKDGILPGIFYTPNDKVVTPLIDQLLDDIDIELEKYE